MRVLVVVWTIASITLIHSPLHHLCIPYKIIHPVIPLRSYATVLHTKSDEDDDDDDDNDNNETRTARTARTLKSE